MFDLSFAELIVVAIVALLVIGPSQMPGALRAFVRITTKAKHYLSELRQTVIDAAELDELQHTTNQLKQEKRYILDEAGEYQEVFDISEFIEKEEKKTSSS